MLHIAEFIDPKPNAVWKLAQQCGAGRRRELALEQAGAHRHPLQQRERAGRRHRQDPVRATHEAVADRHDTRPHAFDGELVHRDTGADDVDEGVFGTDLMEVHTLRRQVVRAPFGENQRP